MKLLVSGATGFLGSHVVKTLPHEVVAIGSEHDLRNRNVCEEVVKGIDGVIHLAGNVGGIEYNKNNPATLFYDNLVMGVELMEAARKLGVKKFLTVGTVCSYPKHTPTPFSELNLWEGYPEETNAAYGIAKKALLVQSQAYRQQYGFNAIYVIPVNLYGPGDTFDESKSHVIPALIKKFVEAKQKDKKHVEVWGTGTATREFLYVKDAARGIALAFGGYDKPEPVNLGSGKDITIHDLAYLIKELVGFKGEIIFNLHYPDGQPKRMLDVSRAKREFGFTAQVDFREGLKETIEWYISQL